MPCSKLDGWRELTIGPLFAPAFISLFKSCRDTKKKEKLGPNDLHCWSRPDVTTLQELSHCGNSWSLGTENTKLTYVWDIVTLRHQRAGKHAVARQHASPTYHGFSCFHVFMISSCFLTTLPICFRNVTAPWRRSTRIEGSSKWSPLAYCFSGHPIARAKLQ